jgi:hypothetical protein
MKKYSVSIVYYTSSDHIQTSVYQVIITPSYRGEEANLTHAIYKAANENGHRQYIAASAHAI